MSKLTITRAYDLLADKGHTLVKGLPFDMSTMTANYLVRLASGEERVCTPKEIIELCK